MRNLRVLLMIPVVCFSFFLLSSCHKITGCKNPSATNYNADADIDDRCSCTYDGVVAQCGNPNPANLYISPVMQETEVWCWLAVAEMVFKYYELPNVNPGGDYQCGIVGAVGYSKNGACDACNQNCGNCVRPAGDAQTISYMLTAYPKVACRNIYETNNSLKSQFVTNYLDANLLISELDNKRPVISGINPGAQFVLPGNSQHVALIVGYYFLGLDLVLIVNDPFPYYITGTDPYVAAGAVNNGNLSYQIPYANFVGGLHWNTTWYSIGF
ncbi:MAG: hypothetical protein QM737_23495 [Ferruginibacter sp.]